MRSERLLSCIGDINEDYINESEQLKQRKGFFKVRFIIKMGISLAACVGFFLIGNEIRNQQQNMSLNNQDNILSNQENNTVPDNIDNTSIDMERIYINEVDDIFFSDLEPPFKQIEMDWNSICSYFDNDFEIKNLPNVLSPSAKNKEVWYFGEDEEGNIIDDRITLSFYSDYYEDNNPKSSDAIPIPRGVDIICSKIGWHMDYILGDDSNYMKSSINGQSVTIGHMQMEYGPYDEFTNEPAGKYDLYAAQFQYKGIFYEILSQRLSKEEVVQIISNILKDK